MRRYFVGAAAFVLAACSDNTGPTPSGSVGVGFQIARPAPSLLLSGDALQGASAVEATAEGLEITRGSDVLVITKAQLVVKDIKLGNAGCDEGDNDADCQTLHIGPYLVDVPMNGTDGARATVPVIEGSYSKVRLTLHKVTSNDSADAAFRAANPDFRDISIRLEGTYNGTPFVFVNDVNAKLDVPLPETLEVDEEGGDVTVTVDFASWFANPQGGLYSPVLANSPGNTRAQVQNNIRSAFRAFRDNNRDGRVD